MNTLDDLSFFQLGLGNSTDAVRAEIRVTRLDASQTAKILVSGFLPFGDEIGVGDSLVDAVFVELS